MATLVMSIACLLPKRKLQTDRVFSGDCLTNCKIDFRLKQLGGVSTFLTPKTITRDDNEIIQFKWYAFNKITITM